MPQSPPFSPDPLLFTQNWQDTFDALEDFVAIIDADFRLVKINRAMAKHLGAAPEALVGEFCYRVMHNLDHHWETCPLAEMLHTNRPVTHEVNDPHIGVPLLVTVSPLYNAAGKRIGAIHIAKDISALKHIEEELNKKNRQCEERIRERTDELESRNRELERFNKLFVDREFRIKELRDRVAELESALNHRERP